MLNFNRSYYIDTDLIIPILPIICLALNLCLTEPDSRQKKSDQSQAIALRKRPKCAKLLRSFGIGSKQLIQTIHWTFSPASHYILNQAPLYTDQEKGGWQNFSSLVFLLYKKRKVINICKQIPG